MTDLAIRADRLVKTYVPSSEAIALHVAFAAVWFFGIYLVMLDTEF